MGAPAGGDASGQVGRRPGPLPRFRSGRLCGKYYPTSERSFDLLAGHGSGRDRQEQLHDLVIGRGQLRAVEPNENLGDRRSHTLLPSTNG